MRGRIRTEMLKTIPVRHITLGWTMQCVVLLIETAKGLVCFLILKKPTKIYRIAWRHDLGRWRVIKLYLVGDIEAEKKNQWLMVTPYLRDASTFITENPGCLVKIVDVKQRGEPT
tara:strand:- start:3177 stop:3521 length:345 start_codon:yes stop_codon:yes gene_type:complete